MHLRFTPGAGAKGAVPAHCRSILPAKAAPCRAVAQYFFRSHLPFPGCQGFTQLPAKFSGDLVTGERARACDWLSGLAILDDEPFVVDLQSKGRAQHTGRTF